MMQVVFFGKKKGERLDSAVPTSTSTSLKGVNCPS